MERHFCWWSLIIDYQKNQINVLSFSDLLRIKKFFGVPLMQQTACFLFIILLRFNQLFEEDMTASAAWHCHREEIMEQNPGNYHILLGKYGHDGHGDG